MYLCNLKLLECLLLLGVVACYCSAGALGDTGAPGAGVPARIQVINGGHVRVTPTSDSGWVEVPGLRVASTASGALPVDIRYNALNQSIEINSSLPVLINGRDLAAELNALQTVQAATKTWRGDFIGCDLSALAGVTHITGSLVVTKCTSTINTAMLRSLEVVDGDFKFVDVLHLGSFNLTSLRRIGGNLEVVRNPRLASVDGLASMASMGNDSFVRICGNAEVSSFPSNIQTFHAASSSINSCLQPGGYPYYDSVNKPISICLRGCYERTDPPSTPFTPLRHCFCTDVFLEGDISTSGVIECPTTGAVVQKLIWTSGKIAKANCCHLCPNF